MSEINYFVYILLCADGTLYTGIARDLELRILKHQSGKGAKYVRARLPVRLIYSEVHENKSSALQRELEIKSWPRAKKIRELKLQFDS